ncbi:MAG: FmdE, Molybdenum formylmethanofuran dehydrogenase operon [Spirochaetes bacterium ADurb.Bin218]|nr:MAG: FmdE, Molybdenum formylmethanofuran dehydrogenase operon [Spirochaetes bacterium ADurb.Bin218]
MVDPKEWLEFGQKFHGHKCPAMPMGLRVGAAAMNALGVERAKDGELVAFVDLGENHCATCYADGLHKSHQPLPDTQLLLLPLSADKRR